MQKSCTPLDGPKSFLKLNGCCQYMDLRSIGIGGPRRFQVVLLGASQRELLVPWVPTW